MRYIVSRALPSPMNMEMASSSPRTSYEAKDEGMNKRSLEVLGPQRFLLEGSLKSETRISIRSPKSSPLKNRSAVSGLSSSSEMISKHQAATVELEKVWKGFRSRRRLSDCAVLVEQSWWKLLDFALLKLSSVSFFDIEKPETAVSRWSRARTRAAKVGKGLSKDEKAQKLALQHWLEAIDPRHRYGHNLQFYYECWLQSENMEPFFYWLDVGEGKEVNLEEQCSRLRLQQQCIKYLGPKEREAYEVVIEDGKFLYRQSRQLLNTSATAQDDKWIFVLSTWKKLYVGQKKKGKFQHSSFLAGGATSAAGQLVVEDGTLKAVWRHSGHYRPTEENFEELMSFLVENKVDLADVEKGSSGDYHELSHAIKKNNSGLTEIFSISDHHGHTSIEVEAVSSLISSSTQTISHMPLPCLASCSSDHSKRNELAYIRIRKDLTANCLKVKSELNGESKICSASSSSERNYIFVRRNHFMKFRWRSNCRLMGNCSMKENIEDEGEQIEASFSVLAPSISG